MKRGYIGIALGALVAVGAALSLPSCGHSQKLVSVQVQPQTFTFLEPYFPPPTVNGTEQYTVIGTYIHPPATMDLTSQATWKVDDGVVTMSTPGLFTPAQGSCGGGDISASVPEGTGGAGNVMFAFATVTVDNPASDLCPGGGKVATLAVGVVGNGSVTSLPAAISCSAAGGICISTYDVGASVLLTASSATVTWANCPGSSGSTCVVTIPTGGTAVSATF
ncbi:MAG: hypothetical protein WBX02_18340 [Terriglobales bacterium]